MPLGERIILSEKISEKLNDYLGEFISHSEARAAFLITKGGQLLNQRGISSTSTRLFSIVSLISGIFSSTQRLSVLVGEKHFKQFYQEGRRYSVYYSLLLEPFVFVTIFDDRALLGDVQLRVEEMEERLREMLVMTVRAGESTPFINLSSRTPEEAFTDLFDLNV